MIIVLNSYFKRLLQNEGVMVEDDINRPSHKESKKKIIDSLKSTQEVQQGLKILHNRKNVFDNNQFVGYFTFL